MFYFLSLSITLSAVIFNFMSAAIFNFLSALMLFLAVVPIIRFFCLYQTIRQDLSAILKVYWIIQLVRDHLNLFICIQLAISLLYYASFTLNHQDFRVIPYGFICHNNNNCCNRRLKLKFIIEVKPCCIQANHVFCYYCSSK